jgi:hypothetical protein
MKIKRSGIVLTLILTAYLAIAQSGKGQPSAFEIVAVRDNGVDVRLRSAWSYPVSVMVCDTPQRLDDLGYSVEALKGKKWVQLKPPKAVVLGDLPPKYLEVAPGGGISLPVFLHPTFLGIRPGMRLRIVVRVWQTETNPLGITKPTGSEPFLLASNSFLWVAKP